MLRMMCRIDFERDNQKLSFELAHSIEINTSFRNFTDTCVIELPRKVFITGTQYRNEKLDTLIKRGDKVTVQLGYDNKFAEEFKGYVSTVSPTFPVKIECEDEMYLLKQLTVKPKSFESATVKDILNYINVKSVMDYKVLGDVTIGAWQITPKYDTAAKVLLKLKEDYSMLMSFIRGGKLIVGEPYDPSYEQVVNFSFDTNIISHKLEYRRKEDVKFKIKMTSKNDDGKDTHVEVGDVDVSAEQRTFTEMNKSLSELKALGQKYLELLKYDGYRGDFTSFGIPLTRHGYIANLKDSEEKKKDGKYFIDSVKVNWGMDGYRRVNELGKRAA